MQEQHQMIYDLVDDFGKKELLHRGYPDLERKAEFPVFFPKRLAELELAGMSFPEEYGGMDADTISTSITAERIAYYCPSDQLIWTASHGLAGFPIMTFGNEEQKKKYLPRLASGEVLGCYALTEPEAGSDAASIKASAEYSQKSGKTYYTINGTKVFITNADEASVCVLFARRKFVVDKHKAITAFVFETDGPGLKRDGISVRTIAKRCLRSSHFCEIVFDGLVLEEGDVLGNMDSGFKIAMETLNNGRINIAAQSVGIARRALHEAVEYAKVRKTFGKALITRQDIAFKLADLKTRIELAWLGTLEASRAKDAGEDYVEKASMAKLFASETAKDTALYMLEVMGGIGCTEEYILADQIFQDARITTIYEGTSNVQKMVIAKSFNK
ncbi:MAG: hypothetical protein A2754_03305 [Candidatus Magasanikbacteria bacterium RIFCSPHIGHO2_01_FULL_47_8]|uniref:Acyl-CoA dehydrogenase n=1 Tax=Candidatus Magasanikbacteria bacterium RIFCSPHIGHO2_01_FULL_47_8 TaxID=1798673 RepID=A0A1F6MB99_9BACT|nr:MAG: hypothetical protein A2754_03305 [Candidatus Magasanikbacteria bacterium RIFCSPHIGHO2_01_FULL_47_8]